MGAVELAQERVRLAEQRGRAKHAGTSNAMVSSEDVASGSAQAERGFSAGMLQQRAVVSEWRHLPQPHPLERRPKVQRHLQQAASVRQNSSPSTTHATPQRQMATDAALQTHRTGPLATLDNHSALAALALFLEKGRSVLWQLKLACSSHEGCCAVALGVNHSAVLLALNLHLTELEQRDVR